VQQDAWGVAGPLYSIHDRTHVEASSMKGPVLRESTDFFRGGATGIGNWGRKWGEEKVEIAGGATTTRNL
jgi:hypothetical protein